MKRCTYFFLVFLCILSLNACSRLFGTNKRDNAYLTAHNGPPLVVPSDLSKTKISRQYYIPYREGNPTVSDLPPHHLQAANDVKKPAPDLPGVASKDLRLITKNNQVALLMAHELNQAYLIVDNGLRRQKMPIVSRNRKARTFLIKDTAATGGKRTAQTKSYLMVLSSYGQGHTLVSVKTDTGQKIASSTARRILEQVSRGMKGYSSSSISGWFGG